jgi:hypothetical protein
MGLTPEEVDASNLDSTYNSLLTLWTSGIRDYHSLLSDYLTANSIFIAAIGFLFARQPVTVFFSIVIIILCMFGMLMSLQMAIVLGRFSIQNFIWEWRLRGIEQSASWRKPTLFVDMHRFRDQHTPLEQCHSDPPTVHPSWAVRQHRRWWARREISFPLFFGLVYGLFVLWGLIQLFPKP